MSDALTDRWNTWRLARQAEMIAGGCGRAMARRWAAAEAAGRQRMAVSIGTEAAMAGRLDWQDQPDGTTRWRLLIDPALVATAGRA